MEFSLERGFTVSALARTAGEPLLTSLSGAPLTALPAQTFEVAVDTAVLGERAAAVVINARQTLNRLLQRTADGQLPARWRGAAA